LISHEQIDIGSPSKIWNNHVFKDWLADWHWIFSYIKTTTGRFYSGWVGFEKKNSRFSCQDEYYTQLNISDHSWCSSGLCSWSTVILVVH